MKFPVDFIERVREANNIVDVIGQHVQLQKAGSSFRGLCPFPDHVEKTPSFFVSETKQVYHCFGCKKGGSVFKFLEDFQGLSFREAVEYLAHRAHIALPRLENAADSEPSESPDERKISLKLNRFVGSLFQKSLVSAAPNHSVKKYLRERGLTDESVTEFKLGYASPGWHDLADALKRARAPLDTAEKLGLIKSKKDGSYFDIFRDRLMFPIISANGNVLGFGGRTLDAAQQPKYLNSPETLLFSKGRTLYGLHATARYIRAANEAYVVEGYMDLIALYQHGIKNVVATLGTALTLDHAKALQRLCTRVVVLFDSDEAGQAAADKSLPIFLEQGLASRCLMLEGAKDPDEYLKEFGAEAFKRLADQAPEHFSAFLARQLKNFRGRPAEKVEIMGVLRPILNRVRDKHLRSLYLVEVADRLGVEMNWITTQLGTPSNQVYENTNKYSNLRGMSSVPKDEIILVQFMLENREYLDLIISTGVVEKFESDEAQMTARLIVEKYCQNPNDFDKLASSLLDEKRASGELLTSHIALQAQNKVLDKSGERQLIEDCLARVKAKALKRQSRNLLNDLKSDSGSSTEKLEHFMKITKEQKGPKTTV